LSNFAIFGHYIIEGKINQNILQREGDELMKNNAGLNKSELMEKLNANELKEYLNNVIDTEVHKPLPEMNTDLINECVDWCLEIEGRLEEATIPTEDVKIITKSIIDRHYKPTRRKLFNLFTAIAVCIAIVMSIQFVSVVAFHKNFIKDVYNETQHLIHHFNRGT